MALLEHLLGAPFLQGGRTPSGIDCLGVTLIGAAQLGHPIPDPWGTFLEQWNRQDKSDPPVDLPGFPIAWHKVDSAEVLDGDVWLWHRKPRRMPGAGIVYRGRVWTSNPNTGVIALEPHKAEPPAEVWRA